MRTEFTARHTTWNKKLKQLAADGLERVERSLKGECTAHIVLSEEKTRQVAEITVTCKDGSFVAREEGFDMAVALQAALTKVETQAQKQRARIRSRKRSAGKSEMTQVAPRGARRVRPLVAEDEPPPASATTSSKTRVVPVFTHSFPATQPLPEPHIVRSPELVSRKPLTLEEAVKEAAFRDREVFVYRNPEGRVHVLYRQRDGRMGLIEAP